MPRGSRRSTAPPPAPPANAAEGAARVRGLVMKLFNKGDSEGANWRLCAESLFRVAFDAHNRLPDDQNRPSPGASMPGPMTGFLAIRKAILRK